MCWENWMVTHRRTKLDPCLITPTKNNSKWSKGLIIRPKTIKLLKGNIGEKVFFDFGLGNIFLDMTPKAQATTKNQHVELINKMLPHRKGNHQQIKRKPTEWEKIFTSHISDKGLMSKKHEEFIQLRDKRTSQLKMGKRLE